MLACLSIVEFWWVLYILLAETVTRCDAPSKKKNCEQRNVLTTRTMLDVMTAKRPMMLQTRMVFRMMQPGPARVFWVKLARGMIDDVAEAKGSSGECCLRCGRREYAASSDNGKEQGRERDA